MVARYCKRLQNFNGLMEILSGVNSSAVRKVKSIWAALSAKEMAMYEELNQLMDPSSNYQKYREYLSECAKPCLPYFGTKVCSFWYFIIFIFYVFSPPSGIFLTDLTFVDDGNVDIQLDGTLNFGNDQNSLLFSTNFFFFPYPSYSQVHPRGLSAA